MSSSASARVWLGRIGFLLSVLGIAFVGQRLYVYAADVDLSRISWPGFAALFALAILAGTADFLLATAWSHLLAALGVVFPFRRAIRIHAASQLSKYVPGNVMQFVGRQALGVAAGIGNAPLAKSTVLELAFLAIGGALFVPLILSRASLIGVPELSGLPWWSGLALFVALVAIALGALRRWGGPQLFSAGICHLAYLVLSGLNFVACFELAGGAVDGTNLPMLGGTYVIAWLVGLITPGAPAGLGMREAVLLFLLGGLSAPNTIVLAVVLGRMVTVVGDSAFYVFGGVLNGRRDRDGP